MCRKKKKSERETGRLLATWWGTGDAEIKVPSVENRELSLVLSSKPTAGQNITLHASPIDRKSVFVIFAFKLVHLHFPDLFQHKVVCVMTSESDLLTVIC